MTRVRREPAVSVRSSESKQGGEAWAGRACSRRAPCTSMNPNLPSLVPATSTSPALTSSPPHFRWHRAAAGVTMQSSQMKIDAAEGDALLQLLAARTACLTCDTATFALPCLERQRNMRPVKLVENDAA